MTDNTVRYDICDREDDPFMERCEGGDWVNFADYTALAAERDALRAALEAVVDTTDGKPGSLVQECRQIARVALAAYEATKEQSDG